MGRESSHAAVSLALYLAAQKGARCGAEGIDIEDRKHNLEFDKSKKTA